MTDKEEINCNGDPCIWICFPCIFTMTICETCCKATCMFMCCIQPHSVKPNNNSSNEINSSNTDKKEYYINMLSTEIK